MIMSTTPEFRAQQWSAGTKSATIGKRWERFWLRNRDTIQGYLFLSPQLLFYIAFLVIPIFYGAWIALHRWDVVGTTRVFVGLSNFQRIPSDENFVSSLKNTLIFTLGAGPMSILIGLLVALAVNKPYRGMGLYRTLFYLPSVLSVTVVGLVWLKVYNPEYGILAHVFRSLGLTPLRWLMEPSLAMPAIVITSLWWGVGFPMLVFLAGLQDIPQELYEAAKLDGAGTWALFRHITIPGLQRAFLFIFVMTTLGSFQVFGQVYVMTGGGPGGYTRTLVMHIYETSFKYWQLGYGSAMAYVLFFLMFGLSLIQLRLMTSSVE
jgi:multiple sugar transport system permease protein